jgi:hypothetical protein
MPLSEVGVSDGGFGSIAAAALVPNGLAGVINFAGGPVPRAADSICQQDVLISAYSSYGQTVLQDAESAKVDSDRICEAKM